MNLLEICLMILGLGIIIVSFFLVDNRDNSNKKLEESFNQEKTEEIIEEIIEEKESQFRLSINEFIKEIMESNHKELNQLTNEKILAIQEFSDQVMGGIKDSHEEVLFLYKMLNEKEDSLEGTTQANDNSLDEEEKNHKYKNIISLYKQGKSITEISKQLSLGQGEVGLIIDINKRLVK